ncbi:hypothetical protein NDA11_007713 [Ustilago hordei]|nr:hypothetical protein NDA12_003358 [Ustilago hordei]KAJ1593558.1 hypothetical protein NDA15_006638 [Ustilago hordei]KAJ1595685.1 hypothetical protein NDA11_007713 [Ustilago hordei]
MRVASLSLPLLLLLLSPNPALADKHNLVCPLTYSPESQLLTASVSIGTPASTYNLVVDTGSPFFVIQSGSFHSTSSTYDPDPTSDGVEMGGGYMTTNPDPRKDAGPVKPKMKFMLDTGFLNEGSGQRAGGGAMGGNLTISLSDLGGQLKGANGILGLSPSMDHISQPPMSQKGQRHRHNTAAQGQEAGQAEDPSFLHSFLSSDHKEKLGMKGDSHFYLAFSPSNPPTGELVFPLSGDSLPRSIPTYSYGDAIAIDPSSGSTYPAHPFWGLAHRRDLSFLMDSAIVPDIQIDALLFDSGTSGIIAPPSEVEKIFKAAKSRINTIPPPKGSGVITGQAKCSEGLKFGFGIGDKQASFLSIRPKTSDQQMGANRMRYSEADTSEASENPLLKWKSYIDAGVNVYLSGLQNTLGLISVNLKKRHMVKLMKREFFMLLGKKVPFTPPPPPRAKSPPASEPKAKSDAKDLSSQDNVVKLKKREFFLLKLLGQKVPVFPPPPANPPPAPKPKVQSGGERPSSQTNNGGQVEDMCEVTLVGSPQVEQMFPANGKDFKPWILGMEFFQENLMYFNLDSAQTVIVPRNE